MSESKHTPDADSWEANAEYLLARCPHTVRQRPGGGPEDIKSSLVVTFMGMQQDLAAERRKVKEQAAEVERLRAEAASFHMDYRMKCDEETKRLAVEVERLREIVQESAALFRHYEKLHSDKGTVDSLRKAVINAGIAARCEAALASTEGGA